MEHGVPETGRIGMSVAREQLETLRRICRSSANRMEAETEIRKLPWGGDACMELVRDLVYWRELKSVVTIPEGYVLVYQGGHHNVYCDKERHIWTRGGYAGWPVTYIRSGKCDCHKYR